MISVVVYFVLLSPCEVLLEVICVAIIYIVRWSFLTSIVIATIVFFLYRFPIGTFTGTESNDLYNGDSLQSPSNNTFNASNNSNNSSYNDSSLNNQGTRETGIIEKLLVSYLGIIIMRFSNLSILN